MAKRIHLAARLDQELIQKIQALAEDKKISANDLLANAIDAYERELSLPATVSDRFANLEKTMLALVGGMRDFLPRVAQMDEAIWRVQKSSRLNLLFLEEAAAAKTWPEISMWIAKRNERIQKYDEQRKTERNTKQ